MYCPQFFQKSISINCVTEKCWKRFANPASARVRPPARSLQNPSNTSQLHSLLAKSNLNFCRYYFLNVRGSATHPIKTFAMFSEHEVINGLQFTLMSCLQWGDDKRFFVLGSQYLGAILYKMSPNFLFLGERGVTTSLEENREVGSLEVLL